MDNSEMNGMNVNAGEEDIDELAALFGGADEELQTMEKVVLSQNLDGFASCFPDWDLHPPV